MGEGLEEGKKALWKRGRACAARCLPDCLSWGWGGCHGGEKHPQHPAVGSSGTGTPEQRHPHAPVFAAAATRPILSRAPAAAAAAGQAGLGRTAEQGLGSQPW